MITYTNILKGEAKVRVIGLLSQTRGCGTPPNIDVLQSKAKFLVTITEEPVPLTKTERGLIKAGLDLVYKEMDPAAFTGLSTKARMTLTRASCLENTRQEFGTLAAVQKIVQGGREGMKAPVRDLNTGNVTCFIGFDTKSIGTFVFWMCLDHIVAIPWTELRRARVVVVKEPGKARTVTKTCAALKIVLDVISKICSYPLKRGIKSSHSGMGRSNHAWNFFKDMFSKEFEHVMFNRDRKIYLEKFQSYAEVEIQYRRRFVASTDFTTATDYLHHEVAQILGSSWMKRCGLPRLLRKIVINVAYKPRPIEFIGTGEFQKFGKPLLKEEGLREVTLKRGILMGDPMTKPVLHLVNLVTRAIVKLPNNPEILARYFNNPLQIGNALR
jgi:hypothetical protein